MPEAQDHSITGRLKNFLLGNTIATNLALGTVGLFSMPLMGALIGANTAWRKSPPIKASGGWMEWGKSIASKAFTTVLGAVGGASVGILGTAVVGALTIVGGPVGIVAGMGLTGLAASYMGKDATVKSQYAPKHPETTPTPETANGKEKKVERGVEKSKKQEKSAISTELADKARELGNKAPQKARSVKGQGLNKPNTPGHTVTG